MKPREFPYRKFSPHHNFYVVQLIDPLPSNLWLENLRQDKYFNDGKIRYIVYICSISLIEGLIITQLSLLRITIC